MKLVGDGVVYSGEKPREFRSCSFPSICLLPSGRWVCTFRGAPRKSELAEEQTLITWSDDEGSSWCSPQSPFDAPTAKGRAGRFRCGAVTSLGGERLAIVLNWLDHSNPQLPFLNEKTRGILDSRLCLAWSEDAGINWSTPEFVQTPFNVPQVITGPMLKLPGGELACQCELYRSYYGNEAIQHASVLVFSDDDGKSWQDYAFASHDPTNRVFYWDQRPQVLSDGRVLDLFWTFDSQTAAYRNIHARESLDNGRTWSEIWDTHVPGQPAQALSLRDGRVAMVYVEREVTPKIKMRVSSDYGRSWPDTTEVIVHEAANKRQTISKSTFDDAWTEMANFSVGLPSVALTDNGDVLAVFYAGLEANDTDIHWVRFAPRAGMLPSLGEKSRPVPPAPRTT